MNKTYDKSEQNHVIITCSHKTLNLDNSSKNTKFKKKLILNSTLDELFNDTTQFLYDEYIGRAKLIEKKNPFEYIVPPPHKWGRNN